MNNSFFSRFIPKETKFFPLLKSMTDTMLTASNLLIECVQKTEHADRVELYKKIKEQEKIGDKLSNKIFDQLNTTFITPFDREDIHHLANRMDDVTDGINSSAKRIMLYNPKKLPIETLDIAKLIKEGVLTIAKAIDELDVLKSSATNVKQYCSELHDIENKADDVYEHFIIKLFETEKDAVEVIKLKEIVYELEKTTDIAEYVGKIIKTIIVKYS
jgi:Phosphate transport regulator (distant homolog of PhoU)